MRVRPRGDWRVESITRVSLDDMAVQYKLSLSSAQLVSGVITGPRQKRERDDTHGGKASPPTLAAGAAPPLAAGAAPQPVHHLYL